MTLRVLVTGGAGFIGSHTVDALIDRGYEVVVLDNLDPQVHPNGVPSWLNPEATYHFGDVRNRELLTRCLRGVDAVIHDAAAVGVGQSQYQIQTYVAVNVGGTATLLDVLANEPNNVRKLLVASSMSIYGEGQAVCPEHGTVAPGLRSEAAMAEGRWAASCPHCDCAVASVPTQESKPLLCTSIYAQTKKDQEEYTHIFGQTYGIATVALRFFNVYGPRQSLNNPYTGVAAIFSSRIKNGRAPMIYEDGEQSRDFTSVHDIVQAKLLCLEDERADYRSFNVGTGNRTTVRELADLLLEQYGSPELGTEITGSYRKGDIRDCYGDIAGLQELGFRAQVPLREGLKNLCSWCDEVSAVDRIDDAHRELLNRGLVVG